MMGTPDKPHMDALQKQLAAYEDALRDASVQIEEKVRELSLLRRITDIAAYLYNIDVFYRCFADMLIEETNAMNCSLLLLDTSDNRLVLKIARGRNDDGTFYQCSVEAETSFDLGQGVAGKAAMLKQSLVVADTDNDPRFELRYTRSPVGSLICAPLLFRERVIGIVTISHPQKNMFTEHNKNIMDIVCGLTAQIIGNARMHLHQEQQFRSMFEGVFFSIIIIDKQKRTIIDCNQFTEQCFGYAKHELLRLDSVARLVPVDQQQQLMTVLDTAAAQPGAVSELAFLQKNGAVKICEITAGTLVYALQDALRITINDISEKKRIEKQLFQSEKLKSLGELAGGVAHDFNNMLAAIMGRVELMRMRIESDSQLRDSSANSDLVKHLDIIEKAALDGSDTVRRIQEFSRIHDDARYAAPVNIHAVIDDAVEFTRVRWKNMASSKGCSITLHKDIGLLKTIAGNAAELREVFTNIINNAIDAMPDGGELRIRAAMERDDVVVSIEDTGCGIPEAIRDRIFDPFFTTKDIGSTGLGLSVSYGIIMRHGGSIDVRSTVGTGTCFTLKMPAADAAPHQQENPALLKNGRSLRILLIEDDKNVIETLSEMLQFAGHTVSLAENGAAGLQKFNDNTFDLVLTDMGMPGLTGFDVAQSIKQKNPAIPVIMITGWNLKMNPDELRARGVDHLITKPFHIAQIINLIQHAVHV